jgi:hypothetical protein
MVDDVFDLICKEANVDGVQDPIRVRNPEPEVHMIAPTATPDERVQTPQPVNAFDGQRVAEVWWNTMLPAIRLALRSWYLRAPCKRANTTSRCYPQFIQDPSHLSKARR